MTSDGKGRVVFVSTLPECQFTYRTQTVGEIRCNARARFDFRSKRGWWAYGCPIHFLQYAATPALGTGMGQFLYTEDINHESAYLLALSTIADLGDAARKLYESVNPYSAKGQHR